MRKLDIVVSGFIFHEGRLLLILHKKAKKWLPVGGHIEPNESPDTAIVREAKEEVGLDVELLPYNPLQHDGNVVRKLPVPFDSEIHSVGDHDHACYSYLCKSKSKDVVIKKDEVLDYVWLSKEELATHSLLSGVRSIANLAFEKIGELEN